MTTDDTMSSKSSLSSAELPFSCEPSLSKTSSGPNQHASATPSRTPSWSISTPSSIEAQTPMFTPEARTPVFTPASSTCLSTSPDPAPLSPTDSYFPSVVASSADSIDYTAASPPSDTALAAELAGLSLNGDENSGESQMSSSKLSSAFRSKDAIKSEIERFQRDYTNLSAQYASSASEAKKAQCESIARRTMHSWLGAASAISDNDLRPSDLMQLAAFKLSRQYRAPEELAEELKDINDQIGMMIGAVGKEADSTVVSHMKKRLEEMSWSRTGLEAEKEYLAPPSERDI